MGESCTLVRERERSEREHGDKRVDATVKEGRSQEGEGANARRVSLGEVKARMSG